MEPEQGGTAPEKIATGWAAIPKPRIYSTGTAITHLATKIDSLEDARRVVRRYKEQGANSLKEYMQLRRATRQWIAMAAREEGINLTPIFPRLPACVPDAPGIEVHKQETPACRAAVVAASDSVSGSYVLAVRVGSAQVSLRVFPSSERVGSDSVRSATRALDYQEEHAIAHHTLK